MEPEPEDEEQAAAAAADAEAPDESAVLAARVNIARHEVAADSTALDVSKWGLTAAQVPHLGNCSVSELQATPAAAGGLEWRAIALGETSFAAPATGSNADPVGAGP